MTKIHISGWNTNRLQVFSIAEQNGRTAIRQAKEDIEGLSKHDFRASLREALLLVVPSAPLSSHDLSELDTGEE